MIRGTSASPGSGGKGGGKKKPQPRKPEGQQNREFNELHPRDRAGKFATKDQSQAQASAVQGDPKGHLAQLGYRSIGEYQKAHGMPVTGKMDAATGAVLAQAFAKPEEDKPAGRGGSSRSRSRSSSGGSGSGSGSSSGRGSGGTRKPQEGDPDWDWRRDGNGQRGVTLKDGSRRVVDGKQFDELVRSGQIDRSKTPRLKGDHLTDRKGGAKGKGKRSGPSESQVKSLQQDLERLGFSVGPAGRDGIAGKDTRAAISRFQKRSGLEVTGRPDEATRRAASRAAKRHAKKRKERSEQGIIEAAQVEVLVEALARAHGPAVDVLAERIVEATMALPRGISRGVYDERLHPRNRIGQWRTKVGARAGKALERALERHQQNEAKWDARALSSLGGDLPVTVFGEGKPKRFPGARSPGTTVPTGKNSPQGAASPGILGRRVERQFDPDKEPNRRERLARELRGLKPGQRLRVKGGGWIEAVEQVNSLRGPGDMPIGPELLEPRSGYYVHMRSGDAAVANDAAEAARLLFPRASPHGPRVGQPAGRRQRGHDLSRARARAFALAEAGIVDDPAFLLGCIPSA